MSFAKGIALGQQAPGEINQFAALVFCARTVHHPSSEGAIVRWARPLRASCHQFPQPFTAMGAGAWRLFSPGLALTSNGFLVETGTGVRLAVAAAA